MEGRFIKVINNAKKHWQENAGKKLYSYPMTLWVLLSFNKIMMSSNKSSFLLLCLFIAISLRMCSNWLSRLTPNNTSLASGYTLISTNSNKYFHSNAHVLWTWSTVEFEAVLHLSNNDSCSPEHCPDPASTRKLRKSEHTAENWRWRLIDMTLLTKSVERVVRIFSTFFQAEQWW